MPFRYGTGGERERDRRAAGNDFSAPGAGATRFGSGLGGGSKTPSPPRDESGYVCPVRPGDPNDPSEQGLGGWEREDFDTEDDADPIGWLSNEHRGDPEDYHISATPTGDCAIWRRGRDRPVGFNRPAPGMSARDYRLVRDRESGRLMVLRRRNRDRMRRLRHEADQIRRRPTRDRAGQEHAALANLNEVNAEF
jgi:hypothetical protein